MSPTQSEFAACFQNFDQIQSSRLFGLVCPNRIYVFFTSQLDRLFFVEADLTTPLWSTVVAGQRGKPAAVWNNAWDGRPVRRR